MASITYFMQQHLNKYLPVNFIRLEAVKKTNILGTENVIKASIASNVQKVVVLSTDKAVYPINAMGISKAMAEEKLLVHIHMLWLKMGQSYVLHVMVTSWRQEGQSFPSS